MDSLVHCIYASTAMQQFSEDQISALLQQSRAKNARLNITGILLYIDGSFFQVLEGAAHDVASLYERIACDARHHRVTRIVQEPISHRSFASWTMGFATLNSASLATELGENDFFEKGTCLQSLGKGRARRLLEAFRAGRWRTENTGMFKTPGRLG